MSDGGVLFLCALAAILGWFAALTAADEGWFGGGRRHEHDRKRTIRRVLMEMYRQQRSVGRVTAAYECSCGVAWEQSENETAKEYEERMADLDIAESEAKKAP